MSFNLEGYMWDKQKKAEGNKMVKGGMAEVSVTPDGIHHKDQEDVAHISMISDTKLKSYGDRFLQEFMPQRKISKKKIHLA